MRYFWLLALLLPLQLFGQIHDLSSTSLDYTDTLSIAALGTASSGGGEGEQALSGDYYIDATSGDDSYPGTSSDSAWASVSKLNTALGDATISSGDTISFKRGEVFQGDITLDSSTPDTLVFTAYGSGAAPIISGKDTVEGTWSNVSGNVYKVYEAGFPSDIWMLNVDSNPYEKGREPDEVDSVYFDMSSDGSSTSINDATRSEADDYWNGGDVFVRMGEYPSYQGYTETISDFADTVITLSGNIGGTPQEGFGYVIMDHKNTLDTEGEWAFHDDTLYLYLSTDPNSSTVEYTSLENGFDIDNTQSITIENLVVEWYNGEAINVDSSDYITIKNDSIYYAHTGVEALRSDNNTIQDNLIQNMYAKGINYDYSSDGEIRSNELYDIGRYKTADTELYGYGYNAVFVNHNTGGAESQNWVIARNTIDTVGYNGIVYFRIENIRIDSNIVRNFNWVMHDGGGIYSTRDSLYNQALIRYNMIYDGGINGQSWLGSDPTYPDSTYTFAHGIYLDDYSRGQLVQYNTVWNCYTGIYIHNADSIDVFDNVLWNNTEYQLYSRRGGGTGLNHEVNEFYGNELTTWLDADRTRGTFTASILYEQPSSNAYDSNYHFIPAGQYNAYASDDIALFDGSERNLTELQAETVVGTDGVDTRTQYYTTGGANDNKVRFFYNLASSAVDSTFTGDYEDKDGNVLSSPYTVQPFTGTLAYLYYTPPDTADSFSATGFSRDSVTITASNFDTEADTFRVQYALDDYPADEDAGSNLIATGDTSSVSANFYIDSPSDTTYYFALFHGKSATDTWTTTPNKDTTVIDSTGAAGGVVVTDDFNGYTSPLSGNDKWSVITGDVGVVGAGDEHEIQGNQAADEGYCYYSDTTFTGDQYSELIISGSLTNNYYIGVTVRSSSNNCYGFYVDTDDWYLFELISGSWSEIASGNDTFSNNDTLRLEVSGTTLTAKQNGSTITTQTDNSLSTGAPGVAFYDSGVSKGDDWEGGDLVMWWMVLLLPGILRKYRIHIYTQ